MTTDDIKLLKYIKIDRWSVFCNVNDYRYTPHIICTSCINDIYRPTAIVNSYNGLFLIDYTKTVKRLLENPFLLDSNSNVNYFVVANRNNPDMSRFNVHYIKYLTPKRAQSIIDANVAAFAQYNIAINEQNLINAINKSC